MVQKLNAVSLLAMAAFLLAGSIASGKIIYVDDDATGANNGSSWADAYKYLQEALADADSAEKPVEIRVAQGVYKPDQGINHTPGNREETFQLISDVSLKGGYAGFGENDPNDHDVGAYKTVLSGDLAGNDIDINDLWKQLDEPTRDENSYHVVTGRSIDDTALLDGFTISSGNADGSREFNANKGSGLYNYENSNITITNCTFTANSSASLGGGIYNKQSHPILTNCTFSGNSADPDGGGMYNEHGRPILTNCTFSGNWAYRGGGMSNYVSDPIITNCTFSGNCAMLGGGGMSNYVSNSILTNCTFSGNWSVYGGGIWNYYSNPIVRDCQFKFSSSVYGAGMSVRGGNPEIINCVFSSNYAELSGGLDILDANEIRIVGCLFTENESERSGEHYYPETSDGGGIGCYDCTSVTIEECIFHNNESDDKGGGVYISWSHATFSKCIFKGNQADGEGGAVCNDDGGESTLMNCRFEQNEASKGGSIANKGDSSPVIVNCLVTSNIAHDKGGAILSRFSNTIIKNCTFTDNHAPVANFLVCVPYSIGDASDILIESCIVREGEDSIVIEDTSSVEIRHSNIEGGSPDKSNIDVDPLFADPGYWDPNDTPDDPNDDSWVEGDYHLKSEAGRWDPNSGSWVKDDVTSPCIDTGDPNSPINLEPFPNGGIINMGAYGGTAEASKSYFGEPVCETIVAGDINGDCKVDFKDFALMAYHWLEDGYP